jgi:NADPH:quinone reductase-like Zn-dependent oxidoreductase
MTKAVQFDSYGGLEVLEVRDVPRPVPADGDVLVEVRAAGINISEAAIRSGAVQHMFPATFPSGQGSDLAGVVAELGSGATGFAVGDEVIGFSSRRSSHAEYVTVPATQLASKPSEVSWEVAGSLYVAGCTAYGAVRAVHLAPGDTVAIAGAAGGVGSIAVQLARRAGATVLGIAGPSNDDWLAGHGAVPVNYGEDLATRLRAAAASGRIDALLDFFGGGYVAMAVEDLAIPPDRVDTITDFLPWSDSGSCRQVARMRRAQRWSPSWPTWSHAVSWTCRSAESSPSTMYAMRTASSKSATPEESWYCAHERRRHRRAPTPGTRVWRSGRGSRDRCGTQVDLRRPR